jgi:YbbR domain-containing protein
VEVVGGADALATITEAITEPVPVEGVTASFGETVAIGSPDPSVRLRTPQVARVSITVTAAPVQWTIADVPIQIRNATRSTLVTPRRVNVSAQGPRDSSSAVAADFDAFVDVAGLPVGTFDLPVRVVPPPRVGVAGFEPARVRVEIR